MLIASPLVDNLMMYADSFHSYAVALVVPEFDKLREMAASKGLDPTDTAGICSNTELVAEVLKSMIKVRPPCQGLRRL